ncbi:YPDG domain-containing protein, partial [Nosocomiicoccus sp. HMSC067E10]|uniref:YPDG domain-containing protein n=1 Tax=Nosocomiicoccus sp. HMSC067E10 TaxID=1739271 RepID=UPI000AAAECB2
LNEETPNEEASADEKSLTEEITKESEEVATRSALNRTAEDEVDKTSLDVTSDDVGNARLDVDGVKVIESGTDQEDARRTVNGTVYQYYNSTPTAGSVRDGVRSPLEDVRVYAQWFEKSGAASPIYTTKTDAQGNYHIVMKDFVLADGTTARFDADPLLPEGEKFRVWAETPDGLSLIQSWNLSQVGPRGKVMDTMNGARNWIHTDRLENFNFAYAETPDHEAMHNLNEKVDNQGFNETSGQINGRVFWENSHQAGASNMSELSRFGGADTPIRDVEVIGSYLSDYAVNKIYNEAPAAIGTKNIRGNGWTDENENALQAWIKEQIELEGKDLWIGETVSTRTDADGKYVLQFNGTYGQDYNNRGYNDNINLGTGRRSVLYREDVLPEDIALAHGLEEGSTYEDLMGRTASSPDVGNWWRITSQRLDREASLDAAPKHINIDWTYVSIPGLENFGMITPFFGNRYEFSRGSATTGFLETFRINSNEQQRLNNVNFGMFLDEYIFGIDEYNTTTSPALPGANVSTTTVGLPSSDLGNNKYQVVWYDKDGNIVHESEVKIPSNEGKITTDDFKVPENAQSGDIFTAKLFAISPGEESVRDEYPLAQDSFIVKLANELYEPSYEEQFVVPGTPSESEPTFKDKDGNVVSAPEGSKYTIGKNADGSDFVVPDGYTVTVDETTGVVTVTADPEALDADTVEEFDVPVKVTYEDGSTDEAKAKFKLDTDGDGTPDIEDEDDDGDGVPDETEKDHNSNPKNPDSVPNNEEYEPGYEDGKGKPGEDVTVPSPEFKDKDGNPTEAPDGTKFTPGEDAPEGVE